MLGVIELKDIVKDGIKERFDQLRAAGIRTVMITGDNPLTAAAIAAESGVDEFLAEATPENKLALIRKEQEGGQLVAMTGDGTNDAPALAQADVGVAMNAGTQAAKEAGNMVDLDSNPTKLLDVVAIGKQMLITRGALTTFSIANDLAKYFAIIPALFVLAYPQLNGANVLSLRTPESAILSAVIFNAIIIVLLVPLALRGVRYVPRTASALLRRNVLLYGVGGVIAPFIGIKLIDILLGLAGVLTCCETPSARSSRSSRYARLRRRLPGGRLGGRPGRLLAPGERLDRPASTAAPSARAMIGQTFTSARYFHPRPTALAVDGKEFYDASTSGGSNLGPNSKALAQLVAARAAAVEQTYGVTAAQVPADMVTASFSGLDPDISMQNARIQAPVVARARGIPLREVLDLIRVRTDDPTLGFIGTTRINVLDLNLALDRSRA